jgi:hypothetical protein
MEENTIQDRGHGRCQVRCKRAQGSRTSSLCYIEIQDNFTPLYGTIKNSLELVQYPPHGQGCVCSLALECLRKW